MGDGMRRGMAPSRIPRYDRVAPLLRSLGTVHSTGHAEVLAESCRSRIVSHHGIPTAAAAALPGSLSLSRPGREKEAAQIPPSTHTHTPPGGGTARRTPAAKAFRNGAHSTANPVEAVEGMGDRNSPAHGRPAWPLWGPV